jgi:hypothetical protein
MTWTPNNCTGRLARQNIRKINEFGNFGRRTSAGGMVSDDITTNLHFICIRAVDLSADRA